MSVTDQQLRAIAFLALAARPTGAPRWNEQGLMSNLAKVRDRSVAAVTIAAIQAAEDRHAVTPGVIPSDGPHWRKPTPSDATSNRRKYDRATHCGICSEPEDRCRARWADDHEFEQAAKLPVRAVPMPDNVHPLLPRPVKDRREWVPETDETEFGNGRDSADDGAGEFPERSETDESATSQEDA